MAIRVRDLLLKIRQNWLAVAGVLFLLLIFLYVAYSATTRAGYCVLCHEMQADVESWKVSNHANVTCVDCHRNPRLAYFLLSRVYLPMKETYQHITGRYPAPINGDGKLAKEISDANCVNCHNMETRKVSPSKGIIINHEKHMERNISCTVCHNRTAHPRILNYLTLPESVLEKPKYAIPIRVTATKMEGGSARAEYYVDNTRMVACARCHNGKTATDKCSACHTKDFELKPGDHEVREWNSKIHGRVAVKDMEPCASCHKASFCYNCHKVEMPHLKANWVKGKKLHGPIATANRKACDACHPDSSYCDVCHHKDWDKSKGSWIAYHQNVANLKGVTFCLSCHSPVFCAVCHVKSIQF